jgi:hypothetical protein
VSLLTARPQEAVRPAHSGRSHASRPPWRVGLGKVASRELPEGAEVLVTGYDDRHGCGYVLRTGPHAADAPSGSQVVTQDGVRVMATPELAASLRDALAHRPVALLSWSGPEVPLTLDDRTVLAWLRHTIGGVLTVVDDPGPDAHATHP